MADAKDLIDHLGIPAGELKKIHEHNAGRKTACENPGSYKMETCYVCAGSGLVWWDLAETPILESQESECDECFGTGEIPIDCQICGSPLYKAEGAICDACLETEYTDKIEHRRRIALLRYQMAIKALAPGSRFNKDNSLSFWAHGWDRLFTKVTG